MRGEESREFSSSSGESITVRVCATEPETAALLSKVMGGHATAAALLARAAHDEGPEPTLPGELVSSLRNVAVDVSELGVWIDPIGKEYITGLFTCVMHSLPLSMEDVCRILCSHLLYFTSCSLCVRIG